MALSLEESMPVSGDEEPLFSLEAPLYNLFAGDDDDDDDDASRTQNASRNDWERESVIQRIQGNIHTRVDLMDVFHGTYDRNGDEATLMVFRFRFDPQKNSRRVIRARVNIEFFAATENGSIPIVDSMAPEETWTVLPTTDQETVKKGGQLSLNANGVSFLDAGATATLENTINKDVDDATTVTGSINLGTGKNYGEAAVASWNIRENKRRSTGVPDSLKVAVLLRREDSLPFNAKVTLEAEVDFKTSVEQMFNKLPLDDPILFNPKATHNKPKKRRVYDAENLSSQDLYSLCAVRMAVEAPFTSGKKSKET